MPANKATRARLIAYWIVTALIALEMALGGVWDLLRTPYVRAIVDHIHYPEYVLIILGAWKVAGAIAILIPGYALVKEWAYAGGFFVYTGAVASHVLAGDGPDHWAAPAVFALMLVASWWLRPPTRRLDATTQSAAVTPAREGSSSF
jgi:hypothetical protein